VKNSQKRFLKPRRIVLASVTTVAALAALPLASVSANTAATQTLGVQVHYPESVNCLFIAATHDSTKKVAVSPSAGVTSVSVQVSPGDTIAIEGARDTPCDGAPYEITGYYAEYKVGDRVPAGTVVTLHQ
jgi:hypothetical protein